MAMVTCRACGARVDTNEGQCRHEGAGYVVGGGRRVFGTLEEATAEAGRVFERTGAVVSVEEATRAEAARVARWRSEDEAIEFRAAHAARGHQPVVGMPFVPGSASEAAVPGWLRCLSCGEGIEWTAEGVGR